MGTATVTGELRDIAMASLYAAQGRIGWRLKQPALDTEQNIVFSTKTRYTTPAADGTFALYCWSTTTLIPQTAIEVWWEWIDPSPVRTLDELRYELRVPPGGGEFAKLVAAPPPPGSFVLVSRDLTASELTPGTLTLDTRGGIDPETGELGLPYYAGQGVTTDG